MLDQHREQLIESGERTLRRRRILETRILKTAEDMLRRRIGEGDILDAAVDRSLNGDISPRQAAEELLKTI